MKQFYSINWISSLECFLFCLDFHFLFLIPNKIEDSLKINIKFKVLFRVHQFIFWFWMWDERHAHRILKKKLIKVQFEWFVFCTLPSIISTLEFYMTRRSENDWNWSTISTFFALFQLILNILSTFRWTKKNQQIDVKSQHFSLIFIFRWFYKLMENK